MGSGVRSSPGPPTNPFSVKHIAVFFSRSKYPSKTTLPFFCPFAATRGFAQGRRREWVIAEPGEVLGLHAVITGGPYELTVETMQPCQLNFVGREDMLRFLNEHADAALHATQHLARDCSDSYGVVRTIGLSHSVSERFARFLLETAEDGEVSNGTVRVRLAMTHEEISQLVGTSRETITRLLSEFRRNSMAELKGSTLIIHNHPALKSLVGA